MFRHFPGMIWNKDCFIHTLEVILPENTGRFKGESVLTIIFLEGRIMVKGFTILLALIVGLSFGGMTSAKSLGDSSSIQSTFPLGTDGDKEGDKDGKGEKMDDKKGDDKEGEDKKGH